MKTFKKIFCIMLSVVMLMSCAVTAFGADDNWFKKISYTNGHSQSFNSEEEVQSLINQLNSDNVSDEGNTVCFNLYLTFSYRDTPEYNEAKEKYITEASNVPDDEILAVKTAAMKEGYEKFFKNTIANNTELFDLLVSYGMEINQSADVHYYDGSIVAVKSFTGDEEITPDFVKTVTSLDSVEKVTVLAVRDTDSEYTDYDPCPHICHQSNKVFIWRIIRFFSKLFGINKICTCGKSHY